MNVYEFTKEQVLAGIATVEQEGTTPAAYGQAMMWNLLQYYKDSGRSESDIRDEVTYALENLDDDGIFHVSRN